MLDEPSFNDTNAAIKGMNEPIERSSKKENIDNSINTK